MRFPKPVWENFPKKTLEKNMKIITANNKPQKFYGFNMEKKV